MVAIFLVIIGLALVVFQFSVIAIVKNFLVKQRVNLQSQTISELALSLANYSDISDSEKIYETMVDWGRTMGGRALLLDVNGVVQIDSFSQLDGQRLDHAEVDSIRTGLKESSYGLHKLAIPYDTNKIKSKTVDTWCVYYATAIMNQTDITGILLVSLPIQDVMDMTSNIGNRMQIISIIVLLITILLSMLFTGLITRPIAEMTTAIRKISRGDFSGRVHAVGSSELTQLSSTFNMMSERLENLDKSRNEFLANASHELKTPLTSMKILIESLLTGNSNASPELYKEFLTDINNEIDRLAAIVKDLLTIVQVDTDVLKLNKREVDINNLIDNVYHSLELLADRKFIELKKDTTDNLIINADDSKLTQALFNLVDNAIKYSPEKTQITFKSWRKGRVITLQVIDNGIGIPEKDLPHIFDRFYRVDKARSRATGGTGLGLSIVKSIVNMHHGVINVESIEGTGTVFTIELPV